VNAHVPFYNYKISMVQTSFEYRQTVLKNALYFLIFIYSDNEKSTYFDTDTCKGLNDIFFTPKYTFLMLETVMTILCYEVPLKISEAACSFSTWLSARCLHDCSLQGPSALSRKERLRILNMSSKRGNPNQ